MLRARCAAWLVIAFGLVLACREPAAQTAPAPVSAAAAESLFLALGGQTFTLELALDPATRQRGLGGRASIGRNAGMFFAFPSDRPLSMVMRDCPIAIDVAFLDAKGRVVAVYSMPPERPREPGETLWGYESRLPEYPSRVPARFAIELAGGRLAELGIGVGTRVAFDAAGLAARAR